MRHEDRILSRPVRLHWAGWETNTLRLQQAGWQLSAEQDIASDSMRLAIRHEASRVYGLTARVPWHYMHELDRFQGVPDLPIQHIASRYEIVTHEMPSLNAGFRPIDAMPQFTQARRVSLDDFAHFAAPLARTEQIIVPDEDVTALMDRILKLQDPARMERVREEVRRSHEPGLHFSAQRRQAVHAQIISFPQAA